MPASQLTAQARRPRIVVDLAGVLADDHGAAAGGHDVGCRLASHPAAAADDHEFLPLEDGRGNRLFSLGLVGVIVRRHVLVMLMCMELMLNGVNLSLVTFAQQTSTTVGAVLVFLIFVVATVEIALAIPIVLLLVRTKRTLDLGAYIDLKG